MQPPRHGSIFRPMVAALTCACYSPLTLGVHRIQGERLGACGSLGRTIGALVLCSVMPAAPAGAAAVLRSAQVTITVRAPASCEVSMTLAVEGAAAIDHRIEALEGTIIDGLRVQGAAQSGEPRPIG